MTGTNREQGSVPTSVLPSRRPWRRVLALLLIAAVIAGVAWVWTPAQRYGQTGAAYGARVACSCRYLGGRTLADCHKDMEGAVGWVSLSEDPAAHSVTASYPLVAHQTAVYREGWGCQLQPWTK
jgi:hypothetical protein